MASEDATIAFWVGTSVTAASAVFYGFYSLYPRRENGQKVALWLLVQSLFTVITQAGLLIDLGSTLRDDGVEFNWSRWIAFAVSFVTTSVALGFYLWYEFVEALALVAFSALFGVTALVAGLCTGDRIWPPYACAALFGAAWVLYMFLKPTVFKAPAEVRSHFSKWVAAVLCIGYALAAVLAFLTLLLSNAFLGTMTFATSTWFYGVSTMVTTALPLVAVFDYQPQPDTKLD
jgi:drug/metabolite transporter (DMT)-like permease